MHDEIKVYLDFSNEWFTENTLDLATASADSMLY